MNLIPPFLEIDRWDPGRTVSTIVEIGSYTGKTTRTFAETLPDATIWAFEPTPASFHEGQVKVADLKNVTCMQMAVGDRTGTTFMDAFKEPSKNRLSASRKPTEKTFEVEILRIDDFSRRESIEKIDLLHIDADGDSMKILNGCGDFIKKIDFIMLNASMHASFKNSPPFEELYKWFAERDFHLFRLYGQLMDKAEPFLVKTRPMFANAASLKKSR